MTQYKSCFLRRDSILEVMENFLTERNCTDFYFSFILFFAFADPVQGTSSFHKIGFNCPVTKKLVYA